ncbi:MAG: hypothetical protein J6X58_02490 [Bacteroidales bacterium]|nr:hypothetical protein [Bacteroidales bacterium]
MKEIPPFSQEKIHELISNNRLSQFQLRRQADGYLLIFCLFVLTLAASILWHTAAEGLTPLNVAVLILAVADAVVALRAARSLWLMWQTHRLRHRPYRMARYAERLNRLSRRRQRWLGFVLHNSYSTSYLGYRRLEFVTLRLPSYAIAICLFLLIAINADKTFAAPHNHSKILTTSDNNNDTICNTILYFTNHK